MPSVADWPVSFARARPGASGASVSRVKPPLALLVELPAASRAVVDTVTVPSPRVARSPAVRLTVWAAPLPVRVLLTWPPWPVNTTLTLAPDSAVTLNTPPALVASAAVRLPSPTAATFRVGAILSRLKPPVALTLVLPAVSVAVVDTVTAPWPSVTRSPVVSATLCAAPLPVRFLVTLSDVPVNTTATLDPFSALTPSTPPTSVDSAPDLLLSPMAATVRTGATVSRVKAPMPLLATLPAASVAVMATATAPWPSVVRLAAVRATVCAAPLPVRVLVTLPAVPVNTTPTAAPFSAVTLSTPPAAVASAAVRLPSPTAATFRVVAVSMLTVREAETALVLAAASVRVAFRVCVPSARTLRVTSLNPAAMSAAVRATLATRVTSA